MSFYFERLALDAKSVRSYDDNGNLHVKTSPLTRVQVAPYRGNEIPNWQSLRLDPQKIYRGYRSAEELSKPETIDSVNGIPIQLNHHPDYPDDPAKDTRIGSTGTDARWDEPYLYNSLHFQDKKAIDRINDGSMRELSLAYRYDPDFTPGTTPDGEAYDFVMRNISANHVALVEEGRAGREVLVLDHSLNLGDNDMENEKKPLPQDEDPKIEASEVAAAKQIKDGAQKIIDLHTETPTGEIKDKGDDEEKPVGDEEIGGKDKLIMDILKQLVQSGLSAEVAAKFKGALEELAGSNAEKAAEDEEPTPLKDDEEQEKPQDPPAEKEEPENKESDEDKPQDEPEKDEKDLISDALKACGLDGEDPEVQQAFTAGLKYNGKDDEEKGAEDEEPADMPSGEGAPASDVPAVGMGQDAALKLTKQVERNISAKYRAAEEVASVTGKLKVHAYDSAGDIYIEALKKLGLNVKNIRKDEAQIAYRAYMEGQKNATKKNLAQDSSLKNNDSLISKFLNNVGTAY